MAVSPAIDAKCRAGNEGVTSEAFAEMPPVAVFAGACRLTGARLVPYMPANVRILFRAGANFCDPPGNMFRPSWQE
jgi:hypothetical protein